jgi:hypothetical protein
MIVIGAFPFNYYWKRMMCNDPQISFLLGWVLRDSVFCLVMFGSEHERYFSPGMFHLFA